MNDKWSESFGAAARQLTNAPITDMELGKTLQHIYTRMEQESMRDAREEVNKAQSR
jgi:hypothetical protein